MVKINIKYILVSALLGASLLLGSCEKWLNVSPKTEMKAEDMLSTESGFDDLLTGVYSLMSTDGSYGSFLSYTFVDVLAQYYNSPHQAVGTSDHTFKNTAQYNYAEAAEESRIRSIWSTAYKGIVNLNMGLKYIDDKKDVFSNEAIYSIYKGEFIALRAMLHFDILRLFADAPAMDNGAAINSLAIPYFYKHTNIAQPQLTVRQVLDNVIADLMNAKQLMAPYDPYGPISDEVAVNSNTALGTRSYRLNYYAVTALLARVYLYAGDKPNALKQAKEIVQEPTSEAPKIIFKMADKAATADSPIFSREVIFAINMPDLEKRIEPYFFEKDNVKTILTASADAKNAFFESKGTSDDFRTEWFSPNSTQLAFIMSKFKKSVQVPIITVSEVYLIAAECSNAVDGTSYLNKLRYHRGLNAITSDDDLTTAIYKESRREMIGCGQLFFFYKRNLYSKLGLLDNVVLPGNLRSAYVLPIPKLEIEFGLIKN